MRATTASPRPTHCVNQIVVSDIIICTLTKTRRIRFRGCALHLFKFSKNALQPVSWYTTTCVRDDDLYCDHILATEAFRLFVCVTSDTNGTLRGKFDFPVTSARLIASKQTVQNLRAFAVMFATMVRIFRASPITIFGQFARSIVKSIPRLMASVLYSKVASSIA